MTGNSKKDRIIFIDLMRAFAVLMMVQGHTIDALLSNDYRNSDSLFFAVWFFMRGMTAPIFMFTAGTVFTYLFRLASQNQNDSFFSNPRFIKGIKRFFLLVGLGYLLRYPTATIIDFTYVTEKGWRIFFAVDVLQLIGFGILFLIAAAFIAEKTKLSDYIIFSVIGFSFFLLFPVFRTIDWLQYLPAPVAGYFYRGTGSLFPLFPWAGYVVCGGLLGSYLAKNPLIFKSGRFSLMLGIAGALFMLLAYLSNPVEQFLYGEAVANRSHLGIILMRIGFVLLLNSLISYISISIASIPKIIILIGRNTLLIYVVHLVILYGSAWNPGLTQYFARSFNVWNSVGSALAMITLMTAMVILLNKLKIRNKQLVT
jgi:uncharacterized membrane protein